LAIFAPKSNQMTHIVLQKGREKSIYNRHPWIFSGAIAKINAEDGDIVQVLTHDGIVLGLGFYAEKSQISCRMFFWGNASVAEAHEVLFWENKIKNALALRKMGVISPQTNCYRLIHAEGDFMPGIIADVYNDLVVIQFLIRGTERLQNTLIQALEKIGYKHIYLKAKTSSHKLEDVRTPSGWLLGKKEGIVEVVEHGVRFVVDVEEGQKTGFFLDQRENRKRVEYWSKNKTVLNAFSYTGGFSLYALAGGAKHVDSVDISKSAVEAAHQNAHLNGFEEKHKAIAEDCFSFLGDMPDNYYDLIVLDPPAFAKSQRAVQNATRGYKQINLKAFRKIKPGGLVFTFSCSQNISKDLFQKIVFGAAADAHRNVRIIEQLHQPQDHPINIYHPESEYLKGLLLFVD
jgi:23S rRNA (cytosine1962-C5)-methyltransferase